MARKEVILIRAFAFEDSDGEQHYFTRDNQDTILDIVGEDNLQPYIDNGIIQVADEETMAAVDKAAAARPRRGVSPSATTASAAAESTPRRGTKAASKES